MKNEDIICISSIDWDFIWQGHQEIMSNLADEGNRVLFIENTGVRPPTFQDLPRLKKRIHNWFHSVKGIRQIKENLYVYSPIILPFPYSRIARLINRHFLVSSLKRWIKSISFSNPIIWTFLPTGLVLDIIDAIDSKIVIYYCIDNFSASSPVAKKIRKTERRLLERADLVFVTAKNLYDWCSQYNKNVHTFPFGVNMDIYEKARGKEVSPPKDMAQVKRPIIGYVGGIHKWIDFDLVKFLARTNSDKSFIFVGPLQRDVSDLRGFSNIHFLGHKPYEELPNYVSNFDVCMIPYLITEYTKNVYPTKLNEYLSLGKAVISTKLPEIDAFNKRNGDLVFIGDTKDAFSSLINKSIRDGATKDVYNLRIDTAIAESTWKIKIKKMCDLIEDEIHKKEKEKTKRWKDNILKFYKKSKAKTVPALAAFLVSYIFLFHTPFIWFAAKPLKVSSALGRADAIVVLAGGVGESGKAGQGYEERVEYAVDLFKKGYADHLIFSSGFKYAIKEAEVMKALAVSFGVPADAIILEEQADSTYANIKLSSVILSGKNWKKAIIVSSPYNMLRASLVSKKIAPGMYFMYAPIPHSLFYGDEKNVRLDHILAIAHEYIAIVYYWFKGYV